MKSQENHVITAIILVLEDHTEVLHCKLPHCLCLGKRDVFHELKLKASRTDCAKAHFYTHYQRYITSFYHVLISKSQETGCRIILANFLKELRCILCIHKTSTGSIKTEEAPQRHSSDLLFFSCYEETNHSCSSLYDRELGFLLYTVHGPQ